jgi:hypothetical protein
MEKKNVSSSWQKIVDHISSDYPASFHFQMQEVMKYIYFEREGINSDDDRQSEGEYIDFDDMFQWTSSRSQLLRDLEVALTMFGNEANFSSMDPIACARKVVESGTG